jgi:hypothetical protein
MIKFIGTSGNKKLIGLGLSRRNCELLLQGKPIVVDVEKMDPELRIKVLLIGGETEAAMAKMMKEDGLIDDDTPSGVEMEGGADVV